ncbi:hypothetical protein HanIR_Chr02g0092351 [Helianthus annuus]|nr:hypothetical protein HanIR_Chr02g0092351 [Helianthus annuus]
MFYYLRFVFNFLIGIVLFLKLIFCFSRFSTAYVLFCKCCIRSYALNYLI